MTCLRIDGTSRFGGVEPVDTACKQGDGLATGRWESVNCGRCKKTAAYAYAQKVSARTKRAVNGGATDEALGLSVPFCACGRRLTECDGSRAGCTGQTGMPGVRDTKNPCDMFSPGKPTNGGCQGDGHYLCRECGLFDDRTDHE